MPPVTKSTRARMSGASAAPSPKKKCRPFMKGPAFLPCTHNSRVLPPTSSALLANPRMKKTSKSDHRLCINGIRPAQIAKRAEDKDQANTVERAGGVFRQAGQRWPLGGGQHSKNDEG